MTPRTGTAVRFLGGWRATHDRVSRSLNVGFFVAPERLEVTEVFAHIEIVHSGQEPTPLTAGQMIDPGVDFRLITQSGASFTYTFYEAL